MKDPERLRVSLLESERCTEIVAVCELLSEIVGVPGIDIVGVSVVVVFEFGT